MTINKIALTIMAAAQWSFCPNCGSYNGCEE